jgi:acetolactate synthase I/II/III large subunit
MASITGGELLAKCLINEGITKVFGIPGGQLTQFIDAIVRVGPEQGMEYVLTRHEASCANMADAYYRVSGSVACCAGTVGPGASNMVAGMEAAMSDNIPLLAITPQIHTSRSYPFRGSMQQLDQITLYRPVTKWNALVNRWDRIPELVSAAMREALAGNTGPVHLDIPVDVMFEMHDEDSVHLVPPEKSRTSGRPLGDPDLIEKAGEMLARAEKPIIHPGYGIMTAEAWDELKELAEYLNCPVAPTMGAKGVIPEDHPLCVLPGNGGMLTAAGGADVILSLGCTFSELDYWGGPPFWSTPDAQKVIQVDIDPTRIARNREVDVGIVGDARSVLRQLIEAVSGLTKKVEKREFTQDVQEIEQMVRMGIDSAVENDDVPIHPLRLVKEVSEYFGEEAICSLDGGNVALWGALGVRANRPRSFLWPGGSGHLGTGLPFAMGAKIAAPDRPVYVLHGDGAFMFSVGELETAARLNLPIVDVVANDRSFGMIKGAQDTVYEKRYCGVDFTDVRLDKIAEAMGCFGRRVSDPGGIKPALDEAVNSGMPAVLDVVLDCAANMEPPTLSTINQIWFLGCEGCNF